MKKFFFFFSILLIASSCRLKKHIPAGSPPEIKKKELVEEILAAENHFNTLSLKASGRFKTKDGIQSFGIQFRLLRDSLIWVDLSDPILGLKLARAVLYKDSVAFINRIERKYYQGNVESLVQRIKLDLNFELLQNALSANIINPLDAKQYDVFYKKGSYVLADYLYQKDSLILEPKGLAHIIDIDPSNKKPVNQTFTDKAQAQSFSVSYGSLREYEGMIYPRSIDISYYNGEDKTVIELNNIRNLKRNTPLNTPFSIPGSYEPMP